MREDVRVVFAIAYATLAPLIGVVDALEAFWGARDDPTWEARWEALDPAERSWLAAMATSRKWIATLTDPEEIRLAKGCRRRESRRRLNYDLVVMPILLVLAGLVIAGVLAPQPILFSALYGAALLRLLWIYRRDRQIKGTLEEQRRLAAAPGV
jgi:hypothetical protein